MKVIFYLQLIVLCSLTVGTTAEAQEDLARLIYKDTALSFEDAVAEHMRSTNAVRLFPKKPS